MPIWMVCVSASVNLPLHHKVQKFSSGTSSPGWSRKKGRKTVVVVVVWEYFAVLFSSCRLASGLKGMASLLLGGIDDLCVRNLGCSSVLFALCCVFCMWMLVAMQLSCDVVR